MSKIKTLNDLKLYCQALKQPIIGIGLHAFYRLGVQDFYPNYQMICVEKGRDFKYISKDVAIFCLGHLPYSEKRNALGILRSPKAALYIENFKKPYFFCYKPTLRIAALCRKKGWGLLGKPACTRSGIKLENKILFRELLSRAGVPKPPGEIVNFADLNWSVFSRRYGKFVIQVPHRGGGKGTFFIFNKADFTRTIKQLTEICKETKVLVAKFIQGCSPSLSACITRHGIFCTNLQTQVLDIGEVLELVGSGMFCGHDWSSSHFSPTVKRQAYSYVHKIGQELKKLGYRGIFGLDMILEPDSQKVYVLECNPRLLGSMPTLTMVQLQNQEIPIVALHILEFLGVDYQIDVKKVNQLIKKPKLGAQLILCNKFGRPVRNHKSLAAGVYALKQGQLVFRRQGYQLKDLKTSQEFLLTDNVPYKNTVFSRRNERILRILTIRGILDKRNFGLNQWAKSIVKKVYQGLEFTPCGPRF